MFNVLQNTLVLINEEAIFTSDFTRKRTFTIKGLNYSSVPGRESAYPQFSYIFRLQIKGEREQERDRERERNSISKRFPLKINSNS